MSGSGRRGDVAPRFAWLFAVAFLCLVLPARVAFVVYRTGSTTAAVPAALLFVLPLLYAVPRGRVVWRRHSSWLLAAQAVATYLPTLVVGRESVIGLSGLLGGLLLLTVTTPASWIAFGAIVAVEGLLRFVVLPPADPSLTLAVSTLTVPVNTALTLYGLVRLSDLVLDLQAAESELATLAVARLRLRAAGTLREAIGDRLETITARAGAALGALGAHIPDRAHDEVVAAAGAARQALHQIRVAMGDDAADSPPATRGWVADTVAPRLARLVLLVVVSAISVQTLANVVGAGVARTSLAGAVAVVVGVVALQLYHSLARQDGVAPRGWRWTLAAQVLLSVASFWVHGDVRQLGMAGFAAGSALLLLPGRWGWTLFVTIPVGVGVIMATYSAFGVYDAVYYVAGTAATGIVVYGLSRLTDLAQRIEAARRELALAATVHERVRVAQDTHDLLGLGLSSIALKCDLAAKLIGRDDVRARGELEELVDIVAEAHRDVVAVTDAAPRRVWLDAELAAARGALASAGIDARVEGPVVPVPQEVVAVLAAVVREAVTNVVRHADATWCVIQVSMTGDRVRLRIANDGVHASARTSADGGAGIGNLRARAHAVGGRLTTDDGDDRFTLTVEIPVPP